MKKRMLALLLTFCLIFAAAPVYAGAATGQQVCANAVTVTAGNTACVTLKAENFNNIAALDVYVYYDPAALSVSSTYNGNLLSGAQTSVNTAEAGKITLSLMALNGISGTGNLLSIYFSTNASCTPGTYPVTVAIGRAYDGNLQEATVGGVKGSVTVNAPVETEEFSIYNDVDRYALQKGDTLSYQVCNSGCRLFVSADFTVEYDHELFAFDSVTLMPELTGEGAVYSVNSSVLGQVRIVYANDEPVSSYYLFTVRLKVIADVDTTTSVRTRAENVYRQDLSAYLPGSTYRSVTLQKAPQEVDHPNAFLKTEELVVGRENGATFYLEAGAGIAAADFVINYDPAVLSCVAVTAAEEVADHGGMLMINDNFTSGKIRFSYVNMDAYADTDLPLVHITWKPLQSPKAHYQVTPEGIGVVDTQQNAVTLEYVTDSGCILAREVIAATCTSDGRTHYGCACAEGYDVDIVPMLGHDLTYHGGQTNTCTQIGWEGYETCSRCDYSTYVEIPALGHDLTYYGAQTATCLEIGWEAYETCSRCGYSTYVEISALGHDLTYHEGKTPTCTEYGWEGYETCSRCDHSTYEEIPALDHDLIYHEGKTPTCTEYGWEGYETCSRCDYSTYEEIPALDHDLIWYEGQAATCTENGWDAYVACTRCDFTTYTQIPALGHELIRYEGQAATCTENGWEAYETCPMCMTSTYVEIPALGHDLIYHEGQEPTYSQTGWEAYETCSRCDHTTYVELPKLFLIGDVNLDGEVTNDDVVLLLWHTLFPEDYPLEGDLDFSRDGNIDNSDVVTLLWHSLFPEDYPLI